MSDLAGKPASGQSSERELPDSGRQQPAPYDLWAVAGVIWRSRLMVFAITAGGTSLVLAYAVLSLVLPAERSPMPNIYRPSALLLINQGGQDLASRALSSLGGLSTLVGLAGVSAGVNHGELAITLMNGRSIIDPIAEEFDLVTRWKITEDVRGNVRKRFRAKADYDLDPRTRTLRVSFRDPDAAFAADVVNRLVESLEQRLAAIGIDRSRRMRDLLAARHGEVEQTIAVYAERIKEFQQRYGVLEVETLAQELVTRISEVYTQLLLKEVEIQTYAEVAPGNDPGLLLLQTERENLLQLIEEMESGYSEYEQLFPTQEEIPDLALEFAQLRLELAVQTELYKVLSEQYELEKLRAEGEAPIFQVLELAEVPDLKDGPSRRLIMIVAFFVWLAIAVLAALLRNIVRGRSAR